MKEKLATTSASQRYLMFTLGLEFYAIPLLQVREVIGWSGTTPIPYAPSHFKGVINLRGRVISVIDLRTKLQLPPPTFGPETSIIILDFQALSVGIIVDSVDCVLPISQHDIEPANDATDISGNNRLHGLARRDRSVIMLLDIAKTIDLDDRKLVVKDETQVTNKNSEETPAA